MTHFQKKNVSIALCIMYPLEMRFNKNQSMGTYGKPPSPILKSATNVDHYKISIIKNVSQVLSCRLYVGRGASTRGCDRERNKSNAGVSCVSSSSLSSPFDIFILTDPYLCFPFRWAEGTESYRNMRPY